MPFIWTENPEAPEATFPSLKEASAAAADAAESSWLPLTSLMVMHRAGRWRAVGIAPGPIPVHLIEVDAILRPGGDA